MRFRNRRPSPALRKGTGAATDKEIAVKPRHLLYYCDSIHLRLCGHLKRKVRCGFPLPFSVNRKCAGEGGIKLHLSRALLFALLKHYG